MRANSSIGKYSHKKFSPPATRSIDKTCQQWKQKNAEARVAEAQIRILEKQQAQRNEGGKNK
ncbi:hypothetical protein C1752_08974 [Acaryochloris thomasi RCC1774]|uniref:Uncharacterized protein n=1 Tax=Acaryochloris thomasi RCC1774 TaxID=1764569 RepID=A0A2W1JIC7_9CYAN|nr:hypothetical protein [Acaryochloris thomasi]PZD70832.1 hypothetical protein C1752_08974 [Acaryochloris thomasi RCC1774]